MNTDFHAHLNQKAKNRKKKKDFPDYWVQRKYLEHRAMELAFKYFSSTVTELDITLQKCMTCWNIDFWLARGYQEEEAKARVNAVQQKNSGKIKEKYTEEERRKFHNTNIEFYTIRGYQEEEAKKFIKERQKTFTLEKCIQRHGQENGVKIYKERQERWQKSLYDKTEEEIEALHASRGITLENYIKKYGMDLGPIKYNEWLIAYSKRLTRNGMPKYQKESVKWFESFIPKDILELAKIKEDEFFLNDSKRAYFYDFCYGNVIIEYHGHIYHCNPKVEIIAEWKSPFGITGESSVRTDDNKKQLALQKGFKFFSFYSNSSKEEESQIKKEILEALIHEKNNRKTV